MKKVGYVLGVMFLVLGAVGLFASLRKSQAGAITEISVEHTPCYGRCPVYKVILRGNNQAIFIGVSNTDRIGTYKADVGGYDRLAQAISRKGFFQLQNRYAARVTDQSTVITSVLRGGRRKAVSNYGNAGPQELWEVQTMIDGIVAQAHWTKVGASTTYPAN